MSFGCRRSSDLVLLGLWSRPAAVALIRPLAWEPPRAVGVALNRQKDKKKKKDLKQLGKNHAGVGDEGRENIPDQVNSNMKALKRVNSRNVEV